MTLSTHITPHDTHVMLHTGVESVKSHEGRVAPMIC